MARLVACEVRERHLIETVHNRPEAVEMLLLAAGGERRQRAAVEGPLERDDPVALGRPARRLIFAHHLDGAFHRFRAGIGEEHGVGEARGAQPVRQPLAFRNAVKIGDMQQLLGLLADGLDNLADAHGRAR